jgi:phage terminase large subunit
MQLTAKQKKALDYLTDNTTDYVGYGGAGGIGKSVLGCLWLMELGYYLQGAKFFIGRDSIKDTRASVLKTWSEVSKSIGFTDYKFTDIGILFGNGTEIELLDLTFYPYKDPMFERLGSKEYTAGWIEEASQVHYLAFEVLKTRIGRWKNDIVKSKILCTFNPKKNWVDKTFYRPFANGKENENTRFVYALPNDNPFLPADYIKRLHELKDEATKQRLLYGNFDYDDDPTALISFTQISEMWDRKPTLSGGLKYIVADIARYGSDKAVIAVWDGLTIVEVVSFDISSTTTIQNTIKALAVKHRVLVHNIVCDEDGVGGGIVDTLRGIKGFVNNSTANNPNYSNLKAECGYKLAEFFDEISVSANIDEATKDIINIELGQLKTFDNDKDNKLKILPKDKIKENIGRSPDYLDTFIMRMYFEVKPNISHGIKHSNYHDSRNKRPTYGY